MFRNLIIGAACIVALSAGVAAAHDAPSTNVAVISQDLQTTAGAASYLQQVKAAATQVCRADNDLMHTEQDDVDACIKATTADAIAAANAPLVNALYDHRPADVEMAAN